MGEPHRYIERPACEVARPLPPSRHLAIVEQTQPEDQALQAVFIADRALEGVDADEAMVALCRIDIRCNFAVAARNSLSAVIAREPTKVAKDKMGPLLPYQVRTWPAYLLECHRYARDHQAAVAGKVRADARLAEAEEAKNALLGEQKPPNFLLECSPARPHSRTYLRRAAYTGIKLWLKSKIA